MTLNLAINLSDDSVNGKLRAVSNYAIKIMHTRSDPSIIPMSNFTKLGSQYEYILTGDGANDWVGVYFTDVSEPGLNVTFTDDQGRKITSTGVILNTDKSTFVGTGEPCTVGNITWTNSSNQTVCIFKNPNYLNTNYQELTLTLRIDYKPYHAKSHFVLTSFAVGPNNPSNQNNTGSFLANQNGSDNTMLIILIVIIAILLILALIYFTYKENKDKKFTLEKINKQM